MTKVGILYDNISGNTGDVAIGISVRKILDDLDVRYDELVPGNFDPREYELIIVGGGHILRPGPDFFYDKFKIAGPHILNAAGILGNPDDLAYLNDYRYVTVRSTRDREKLEQAGIRAEVVPCTTMLLEDAEELPCDTRGPALGIHLLPGMFESETERMFVEWASALPYRKYFIPITHYNRDYLYLDRICSLVDNSETVPLLSPREISAFIGKMDYFIGCSLHGGIFSYRHNVPFILFDYDEKMRSFMEDRGLERYLFRDAGELIKAFSLMESEKPDYSGKIESDLEVLSRHLDRLGSLLAPCRGQRGAEVPGDRPDLMHQVLNLQDQVRLLKQENARLTRDLSSCGREGSTSRSGTLRSAVQAARDWLKSPSE